MNDLFLIETDLSPASFGNFIVSYKGERIGRIVLRSEGWEAQLDGGDFFPTFEMHADAYRWLTGQFLLSSLDA